MFRTAARGFATSARRGAESLSQLEAAHQTAIGISTAQGIGQRGFLDGKNEQYSAHFLMILSLDDIRKLTLLQLLARHPSFASRSSPKKQAAMFLEKPNSKTPVAVSRIVLRYTSSKMPKKKDSCAQVVLW